MRTSREYLHNLVTLHSKYLAQCTVPLPIIFRHDVGGLFKFLSPTRLPQMLGWRARPVGGPLWHQKGVTVPDPESLLSYEPRRTTHSASRHPSPLSFWRKHTEALWALGANWSIHDLVQLETGI